MLRPFFAIALGIIVLVVVGRPIVAAEVAPWTRFETAIESTVADDNPFTDVAAGIGPRGCRRPTTGCSCWKVTDLSTP